MSSQVDTFHATSPSLDPHDIPVARTWIHVVSHLDARYGGLSAVVPRLASEIGESSARPMHIAAFCTAEENCPDFQSTSIQMTRWPVGRSSWLWQATPRSKFRETVARSEGIHIHGLWEQSSLEAASAARARRKPYVISAHGMLEPWALRNKKLKKSIYAWAIEKNNLQRADCLLALTRSEAENYREFGLRAPIAIIPNGVSVPENKNAEPFLTAFPHLRGRRIVLFLGRIHYKKGLDILVEAWERIAKHFPESQLVLAGPDFENTRRRTEALVSESGLGARVDFVGMLRDELKWSALAAAECFVLPSYSEGLSVSTLEAMGAGVPVIVSENCHLPEVAEVGAGWVIETTVDQLAAALSELLRNSPRLNATLGQHGRRLVDQKFNWPRIARQMNEVYDWVAGGSEPNSVKLLRN